MRLKVNTRQSVRPVFSGGGGGNRDFLNDTIKKSTITHTHTHTQKKKKIPINDEQNVKKKKCAEASDVIWFLFLHVCASVFQLAVKRVIQVRDSCLY